VIGFHSAIYEGKVRHRRFEPFEREFDYRIFMLYLDLDEIPGVMKVHPLWSTRRRSPARFRRADHLGPADRPLKAAVADLVERRTGSRPQGPIRMLTNLRYLGLVENPVTFYYCFDRFGEQVEAVVAEVTNTPWGDRHAYVMEAGSGSAVVTARREKAMHVSPLMGMDHEYELSFGTPGQRLPVHISSSRQGSKSFDATLNLQRAEINRRNLGRLLVRYPPMSYRATAGIHWQALLTWIRGAKYHSRPDPGASPGQDLRTPPETAKMCPMHGMASESTEASRERAA